MRLISVLLIVALAAAPRAQQLDERVRRAPLVLPLVNCTATPQLRAAAIVESVLYRRWGEGGLPGHGNDGVLLKPVACKRR